MKITDGIQTQLDKENSIDELYQPENEILEIALDEEGIDVVVPQESSGKFARNLVMSIDDIDDIAVDLLDRFEEDRESRKRRDEQYNEGLTRAGLDEDASPDGADFEGASKVVHPMIAEGCIDFAGREIKELIPPNGPVKAKIIGNASTDKVELSQRKVDFMNLICTEYTPYRSVMETMLSQLPLGGSQFIKFWHDNHLKRPMCEFLPIDKVFIPFACSDFYTADRVTVRLTLSEVEFWRRVDSGMYLDVEEINRALSLDTSKTEQTNNVIEGKTKEDTSTDQGYVDLLEIYTYLQLPEDEISKGCYAPYIVTIKEDTEEVLSIYRNWSNGDDKMIKLDHIVMFDFIPWRGAYGIGLGQIIGSLSVAATGSLRALLDAAHINNIPTVLAQKGMKMAGQTMDVNVGGMTYIEGPAGFDGDIRKLIMPLPFNPPSPVLFQLLEWLSDASGRLVKMPDGGLDSMGDRTPASTSLAMIEQNSTTQSSIHQRLHFAQAKCFKIISRLLADFFDPDGYPDDILSDLHVSREMYKKTSDIIPVSDPNIMTGTQRYAQIQMLSGLAKDNPDLINRQELVKRTLVLAQIPDPELLLTIPNQISRANPVMENTSLTLGGAIGAFTDQDHLAHIKLHVSWLMNEVYGKNPLFQDKAILMANHIKDHLAYFYSQVYLTLGQEQGLDDIINDPKLTKSMDTELVDLSQSADAYIQSSLAPFQPALNYVLQLQQQQAQQSQQNNPQMAKIQVEQQKIQNEAQQAQQDNAIKQAELQSKQQMMQSEIAMQQQSDSAKLQIEQMKVAIAKLKAIAEIDATNKEVGIKQFTAIHSQIRDVERMMMDMSIHKDTLEHNIRGQEIGHKQDKILANINTPSVI